MNEVFKLLLQYKNLANELTAEDEESILFEGGGSQGLDDDSSCSKDTSKTSESESNGSEKGETLRKR